MAIREALTEQTPGIERNRWAQVRAIMACGVLALGIACSKGSEKAVAAPTPTPTPTPTLLETIQPGSVSSTPRAEGVTLTFDDLGGGSSIIKVYPGVNDTAQDKKWNGTFKDGDKVPAECKTEGRTVNSDPSVGEQSRSSHVWVRIDGTPGEVQFATAVYVQIPDELLAQLPHC